MTHEPWKKNIRLQEKYAAIRENEVRFTNIFATMPNTSIAFGSVARITMDAIDALREKGIKVGLLRPITLWPFPEKRITQLAKQVKGILVPEMNAGQMINDVRLVVEGRVPVKHFGRLGGIVPDPSEIVNFFKSHFDDNK